MSTKPAVNKPCELGRAMGENLARFADVAEQQWRDAGIDFIPQRCRSCAFKAGTYPNGCVSTVADATKCMMERVPFYCHHELKDGDPPSLCAGWMLLQDGSAPVKAQWEFTSDYTRKLKAAPYPFCHHPDKCTPAGRCLRDPNCCE